MKTFVTGGTGVVGRAFIPRLVEAGHDAVVLTRDPAKAGLFRHPRVTYLAGDLDSAETVGRLFGTPASYDVIFHLAASLDYFGSPEKLHAANAGGTATMARFARHVGARRFVHASSVEAAGTFTLADTPTPAGKNNPPVSPYGASKVAAEAHALALNQAGIPAISLRIGNVYGPGWANLIVEIARALLTRDRLWEYLPLYGERYLSPVHNDDVSSGLLAAARCTHAGIVNLVGQAATAQELFHLCADTLGVPFTCGRRKFGDWIYVTCSQRYLRHRWGHCDTLGYFTAPLWPRIHRGFAMDDSCRVLHWQPTVTLRTGVRLTLQWAREAGLLNP